MRIPADPARCGRADRLCGCRRPVGRLGARSRSRQRARDGAVGDATGETVATELLAHLDRGDDLRQAAAGALCRSRAASVRRVNGVRGLRPSADVACRGRPAERLACGGRGELEQGLVVDGLGHVDIAVDIGGGRGRTCSGRGSDWRNRLCRLLRVRGRRRSDGGEEVVEMLGSDATLGLGDSADFYGECGHLERLGPVRPRLERDLAVGIRQRSALEMGRRAYLDHDGEGDAPETGPARLAGRVVIGAPRPGHRHQDLPGPLRCPGRAFI